MAEKMKVPFGNPDGSTSQEIGTLMEITETKEPWSEFICRSDGLTAVFPQNSLGNAYFFYFAKQVSPLFKKAITNLSNIRKHLALQLDLECGNISEEYFAEEEKTCLLETEKIPFDELKKEVDLLYLLSNMPLDSEEVSGILNCSIGDAERAIRSVLLKD